MKAPGFTVRAALLAIAVVSTWLLPVSARGDVPQPIHPAMGRVLRYSDFSFTPHGFSRCSQFLVTETSVSGVGSQTLLTDGFGMMENINRHWAVGGAVNVHWATGLQFMTEPAVRCRRWFGGEQSVEGSLGWIASSEPSGSVEGLTYLVGPNVSIRYSPTPMVFVLGGVCRLRERNDAFDPQTYSIAKRYRDYSTTYGGIGLGGLPAMALWGLEAVAVGVAVAISGVGE
jgi:hypothetical protein